MDKLYLISLFIFVSGYFFGRWTCGNKVKKGSGFIATILTFVLLNLVHSVVDGTMFKSMCLDLYSIGMAAGHEIIRQPLLYFFFITATAPFAKPMWQKIFIGILTITGIWILGLGIGSQITISAEYLPDHEIALYTYLFFGGDIFHHFMDYLRYRNKRSKNISELH